MTHSLLTTSPPKRVRYRTTKLRRRRPSPATSDSWIGSVQLEPHHVVEQTPLRPSVIGLRGLVLVDEALHRLVREQPGCRHALAVKIGVDEILQFAPQPPRVGHLEADLLL